MLNRIRFLRCITNKPTSGRTAIVTSYGPASAVAICSTGLELQPNPDPDCVRIRVHAASINPLDLMMRQGYGKSVFEGLRRERFPFCLGLDCVGTVESVGSLVQNLTKGDRVMGVYSPLLHMGHGTWSELVDLPVQLVARIPTQLDDHSAAAIPMAAMTAASAVACKNIRRAVIIGGSGGVGLFALQMLKHEGAFVVTVASGANAQICLDYGADLFVDYTKENIDDKVEEQSIDFILDASSKRNSSLLEEHHFRCLRPGATYLTLSAPFIRMCDSYNNFVFGASLAAITLAQSKIKLQFDRNINYEWAFFKPSTTLWRKVVDLSSSGKLKAHVSKVFDLEEIVAAQEYLEKGHVPGKVVISI